MDAIAFLKTVNMVLKVCCRHNSPTVRAVYQFTLIGEGLTRLGLCGSILFFQDAVKLVFNPQFLFFSWDILSLREEPP